VVIEQTLCVRAGKCRHRAPGRTKAEQPADAGDAEPVPESRRSAEYYPRTIDKNGKGFDGGHVGGNYWYWFGCSFGLL
jgi:hypothetical protein